MNTSTDSKMRPTLIAAVVMIALTQLGETSLRAQTTPADTAKQVMKQFVIIFRQGAKQLTETDLKNRSDATRIWAQEQNAAGHKLDPHILTAEGRSIGPDGASKPAPVKEADSITALLFLEARDLEQAADVARSHPALRYGASVEVRAWAPPPPAKP